MSDHSSQVPSIEKLAELLPQYGIDSFIAMGGMGAVYKGRQLSLERDVAIKVLLNQYGEDAVFKESFTTEAKAMARLNHSNLLGVFDYGDIEGMPFIVMEYVEGGSLHEAAWNTAIEPTQAVEIINGICKGLANAHENGIIHRDIKPANILLTLKAVPKVADFGLAHAHDSGDSGLNMGTPGFTAPEVFNDPNQAGQLADIYSVGVIFHQLLTGIDPTGSMEPPSHPTGRLHLDAIWRKATHINPKQRYKNLSEMSTDLEKWSDSKLAAPAVSQTQTNYTPNYTPSRPVQTNAGGGILGKVVIIFVLLGGLALTFQLIKEKESATNQNMVDSSQDNDVVIPVDGSIPGLDRSSGHNSA
jgi:serine/threonine protein kinase